MTGLTGVSVLAAEDQCILPEQTVLPDETNAEPPTAAGRLQDIVKMQEGLSPPSWVKFLPLVGVVEATQNWQKIMSGSAYLLRDGLYTEAAGQLSTLASQLIEEADDDWSAVGSRRKDVPLSETDKREILALAARSLENRRRARLVHKLAVHATIKARDRIDPIMDIRTRRLQRAAAAAKLSTALLASDLGFHDSAAEIALAAVRDEFKQDPRGAVEFLDRVIKRYKKGPKPKGSLGSALFRRDLARLYEAKGDILNGEGRFSEAEGSFGHAAENHSSMDIEIVQGGQSGMIPDGEALARWKQTLALRNAGRQADAATVFEGAERLLYQRVPRRSLEGGARAYFRKRADPSHLSPGDGKQLWNGEHAGNVLRNIGLGEIASGLSEELVRFLVEETGLQYTDTMMVNRALVEAMGGRVITHDEEERLIETDRAIRNSRRSLVKDLAERYRVSRYRVADAIRNGEGDELFRRMQRDINLRHGELYEQVNSLRHDLRTDFVELRGRQDRDRGLDRPGK